MTWILRSAARNVPAHARTKPARLRAVAAFAGLAAAALTARVAAADTAVPGSPPPVRASYQTWTALIVNIPLRDRLSLLLDTHGRFYDDMHPYLLLFQPGLGYDLGHGLSAFAGYGFTPGWNDARELAEEHRAWEHLVYSTPLGGMTFVSRLRFEERFRPGSDTGLRMRALARLNMPLGLPIPLQTVVWDEIFFGLTQPGKWQPDALDQNWIWTGLGYPFDRALRLDVGYLGQVVPRKDATTVHHALSINATLNL